MALSSFCMGWKQSRNQKRRHSIVGTGAAGACLRQHQHSRSQVKQAAVAHCHSHSGCPRSALNKAGCERPPSANSSHVGNLSPASCIAAAPLLLLITHVGDCRSNAFQAEQLHWKASATTHWCKIGKVSQDAQYAASRPSSARRSPKPRHIQALLHYLHHLEHVVCQCTAAPTA